MKINAMTKDVIELWKELGIEKAFVEFECGGDCINKLDAHIFSKSGEVSNDFLENKILDGVLNNVEFYETSSDSYVGEFGEVEVTINDDGTDFLYCKKSTSIFRSYDVIIKKQVTLSDKEAEYVEKYISDIRYFEGGSPTFQYKIDFVKTSALDKIEKEIFKKILAEKPSEEEVLLQIGECYNIVDQSFEGFSLSLFSKKEEKGEKFLEINYNYSVDYIEN